MEAQLLAAAQVEEERKKWGDGEDERLITPRVSHWPQLLPVFGGGDDTPPLFVGPNQ